MMKKEMMNSLKEKKRVSNALAIHQIFIYTFNNITVVG